MLIILVELEISCCSKLVISPCFSEQQHNLMENVRRIFNKATIPAKWAKRDFMSSIINFQFLHRTENDIAKLWGLEYLYKMY